MQMGVPVMPVRSILQASPFLAELGSSAPLSAPGNVWRANLGF
jgi:hypothetical protein